MKLLNILFGNDKKVPYCSTLLVAKDEDSFHSDILVASFPPKGEIIKHKAFYQCLDDPDIPTVFKQEGTR